MRNESLLKVLADFCSINYKPLPSSFSSLRPQARMRRLTVSRSGSTFLVPRVLKVFMAGCSDICPLASTHSFHDLSTGRS